MATKKNGYYDNYGNWVDTSQGQHQTTYQDNYGNDVVKQTHTANGRNAQTGGYTDSYGNYVQTPSQRQAETTAYQAQKGVAAPNQRQYNADAYGNFGNWSIAAGDPMSVQAIMHDGRTMQSSSGTPAGSKTTGADNLPEDDGGDGGNGGNGGSGSGSGSSAAKTPAEQRNQLSRADVSVGLPGQFSYSGEAYSPYQARDVVGNYDPATDAAYQEALASLRNAQAQLPGYDNTYGDDLAGIYAKITGREPFRYDLDADTLYQQYRQQYQTLGRNAMQDTMGQAAALTGGYGSTYAQNAGQQAYNAYLQQLNDRIPELEERAYQRWQAEGDQLAQQYAMARDLSDNEYARYRDQMSDYYTNLNFANNQLDQAYGRGVDMWNREAALNSEQASRDYQNWASGYQLNQDAWDRAVQQYQLDNAANETAYSRQQDEQARLLQLMQIGYTPTDEDLRAAGMSTAEMDAWQNYIAQQNAPKGGGGGGDNKTSDLGEPSLQEYYDELSEMRAAGEIDKDTMYALYQQYAIEQQKKNGTKPVNSNFSLWSQAGGGM